MTSTDTTTMNCAGLMSDQAAQDVRDGIEVGAALAIAGHQIASSASDGTVSCRCDRYRFIGRDEHKRHLTAVVTAEIRRHVESRLALTADIAQDH